MDDTAPSLFSRAGGLPFFEHLVDDFYGGVSTDPVLLPLYPEQPDLSGARHRLTLFLAQYWGGPTTYSEERGHPALRMRHMPYPVGPLQRDHWLTHMTAAIERTCARFDLEGAIAEELTTYFVRTAEHLRNDTGLPITSAGYASEMRRD